MVFQVSRRIYSRAPPNREQQLRMSMVADGENLSVQVRMGAVDRLTKAREKRLGLRVFWANAPPAHRHPIFPKNPWNASLERLAHWRRPLSKIPFLDCPTPDSALRVSRAEHSRFHETADGSADRSRASH